MLWNSFIQLSTHLFELILIILLIKTPHHINPYRVSRVYIPIYCYIVCPQYHPTILTPVISDPLSRIPNPFRHLLIIGFIGEPFKPGGEHITVSMDGRHFNLHRFHIFRVRQHKLIVLESL